MSGAIPSLPLYIQGMDKDTHSLIPLAFAECDDSLPLSGASSIPLCYIPSPSTLFHQSVFHPHPILPPVS